MSDKVKVFRLNIDEAAVEQFPWGTIRWLCNADLIPESRQTFGYVVIKPGMSNMEHSHPNCEEIIYIEKGRCDHYVDGKVMPLREGDVLFVPPNVRHHAHNTGKGDLALIVSYSSPKRETKATDSKGKSC